MSKPPYRVPTMEEIRALPWNGYRVASTFAGGGGSSTGYRMAGFKVIYANEFIPAARETYAANMAPGTWLDDRDIRTVEAADFLDRLGLAPGELDILDGSPPCSSFSTAGSREAGWGKVKSYSDSSQRTDDLFFEYARLVEGIRPKVFIAENVSGLIKGTAKGYFLRVLAALKAAGYRVEARLLDAQWLGVPQARQRLIFVGVREDLDLAPAHPKPLAYRYSVRDAIPWIARVGSIRSTGFGAGDMTEGTSPSPTIMAGGGGGMNTSQFGVEADATAPGVRFFRDNRGAFGNGGEISDRPSPTVLADSVGTHWVEAACSVAPAFERRKFSIAELRRICGFPDDYVLTGTYAQQWERLGRAVPPVMSAAIAATVRDQILRPASAKQEAA